MPLSRWLGREPRTITTHEYDEAGRLTRSVTHREPEWTAEDRGWLQALLAEQAETCRGCGHPVDESADPASAYHWSIREVRCQACAVLEADEANERELRTPRYGRRAVAVKT